MIKENKLDSSKKATENDVPINKIFNVLVLGPENIGKTSLIEYISGLDIFPRDLEIFKIPLNLNLFPIQIKKKSDVKHSEKSLESNENVVYLENFEPMYSLEKLHSCLKNEKDKYEKKNPKFTIKWATDKSSLMFNYSFKEIPISKALNLDNFENCIIKLILALTKMLFEDINCVFIICLSLENYLNDYKRFDDIISNFDKGRDRTITVINKCDIGNIHDMGIINHIISKKNMVFMVNRSISARKKYSSKQFQIEEKRIFANNLKDFKSGLANLEELLNKIVKEIIEKNSKKSSRNVIYKKSRQSDGFETPLLKRSENFQSKYLLAMKKWKEGIYKLVQFYFEVMVFILEKSLKSTKYLNSELLNNKLVRKLEKMSRKEDFSKDLSDNFMNIAFIESSDSIKEKRMKNDKNIFDLCGMIFEKIVSKLKKIYYSNYEKIISDSKKIIIEAFELQNSEFCKKIIDHIVKIMWKEYSDYENIMEIELKRELSLTYINNEKIYNDLNSLFMKLSEENFRINRDIIILKRSIITLIVHAKLTILIEIFSKNYAFYFLSNTRESLENTRAKEFDYDNYIGNRVSPKKGISHNFTKEISVKSNRTPMKKFAVYESSHSKNISQGSITSKNKSRIDTIIDHMEVVSALKINSYMDLNLKEISNFDNDEDQLPDEVVMIWDTTNFITIYNIVTKDLKKEEVIDIPHKTFLENNRFINLPQNVFISGGVENLVCTNLFFMLERKSNKITKLQDMPVSVTRHSLINLKNVSILMAGGKNNKDCFIYDILKNSWEKLNSMNYEREDASLFFFNNVLFCFGGIQISSDDYSNYLIEYTYLNHRQAALWSLMNVNITNPNNNLDDLKRISGCGIITSVLLTNKVYICGGYNNGNNDEVNFVFEFLPNTELFTENKKENCLSELTKLNDLHMCEPNWFQEANFVTLQNKYYNFDIDGNIHIFSIDMEKFFFQKYKF